MTQKKHIAFYIGSFDHGGSERVMSNLASYLYEKGYQVTLVTTYLYPREYVIPHASWTVTGVPGPLGQGGAVNDIEDQPEGIRRIISGLTQKEAEGMRVLNVYKRYAKLRGIWKKLKPDMIISFLGKNNVMALSTAKGLGIPVIVSVRSDPAREYGSRSLNLLMKRYFPTAAGVVLQTRDSVDYFPPSVQKKVKILANPINADFVRDMYQGQREHTIVSVGRLDANKNQGMLLQAFQKLADKYPDWNLALYGDGECRAHYEEMAQNLGLSERAHFAGLVDDVPDRIEKASIYVLTSKKEGVPNSIIEAMVLGLPCISTDTPSGGPRRLIRDGENGYLVPCDDVDALTERLDLLMGDEAKRQQIGKEASKMIDVYGPARVNGEWASYMESLMR